MQLETALSQGATNMELRANTGWKTLRHAMAAAAVLLAACAALLATAAPAFASTYESGHYYHIDIRVDGTFTYTTTPSSEQVVPIVSVTKVWDDAETVDHADDAVTVYLLDEDGEQLYDAAGAARTITLSAENNWTATIEDDDVYYVSEAAVAGYEASYSYGLTVSTEEGTSYTTTGAITVTGITAVSYVDASGETVSLDVSLYVNQASENSDYPYEFYYNNGGTNGERLLDGFLTSSTVTVTVAYDYSYVDENGETQSGSTTGTFTYSDLVNENTCAYKDYTTTEAGFDAVITSEMLTESVYTSIYTRSATITNTPVDDGEDEDDETPETPDDDEGTTEDGDEDGTTEDESDDTTESDEETLPATGDPVALATVSLAACLGALALTAGLASRRRRQQ